MKTIILILISLLLAPGSITAQKKEKIKGDKQVISTSGEITGEFTKLEVLDNIKVEIESSSRNSYVLTTDQNLSEEVKVEVRDGVLKVFTRSKIVKDKKLHLFLNINDIESISLNDDAELKTSSKFRLERITIHMNNSSKIDLDLDIRQDASIMMNDNAGGKMNLNADNIVINMKNRTDLKANIQTSNLKVVLNKSASIKLDGKATHVVYDLEGSSNLNAKKLKSQTAILNSKNNSDIYVDASKTIEINAQGKSKIYVYGNPDIQVKGLTDKSRIIKK
jgi:hypothetical protein